MRRAPVLCAIALAACGSPDAPGPRMDDLSRRTLDAWFGMEHHLGRAGVRHARCTLELTLAGPPRTTMGALLWDGERSRTSWEDEEIVGAADYDLMDWCQVWFEDWWSMPCFRDTRLWGRRSDDGGVTIEFMDADDEPRALVFDAESILTGASWGTGDRRRTARYAYERRDGKCVLAGSETRSADGALACKAEVRYESAKGHLFPASMRVVHPAAPTEEVSEIRFTDWKLDG